MVIRDVGLLVDMEEVELLPGSPHAIRDLKTAGFIVILVSNQPVVARGLASEQDVEKVNQSIQNQLIDEVGQGVDAIYFCPHHPSADVKMYRIECDCRKPRSGLLFQAAAEWGLDLPRSYMIGDRISDIAAGGRAGCRTILIKTGMHEEPSIESPDQIPLGLTADVICRDLPEAVAHIMQESL